MGLGDLQSFVERFAASEALSMGDSSVVYIFICDNNNNKFYEEN